MSRQHRRLLQSAAARLLDLPGDFIFVGASPIRLGLSLMRQAPDRACFFVPFTGGWYQPDKVMPDIGLVQFKCERGTEPAKADLYRQRFTDNIIACSRKLNIVDYVASGSGLASFASLLLNQGSYSDGCDMAKRIRPVVLTAGARSSRIDIKRHFLCTPLGPLALDLETIILPMGLCRTLAGHSGRVFRRWDPRLTEPYPELDWHEGPKPAPASNIAAFRRAAQGIAPERLRAAFGPAYDAAFSPR